MKETLKDDLYALELAIDEYDAKIDKMQELIINSFSSLSLFGGILYLTNLKLYAASFAAGCLTVAFASFCMKKAYQDVKMEKEYEYTTLVDEMELNGY